MGVCLCASQDSEYRYTRIASFRNAPTTLHLDTSHGLAALQTLPSEGDIPNPDPIIAAPSEMPWNELIYSHAALENVERVIVCRGDDVITGLILCYSNGAQASLGWQLHDTLSAPTSVAPEGLWLLVETDTHLPRVVDISLMRPAVEGKSYFHIRWSGMLVWWFSIRQCQLHFDGRHTQAPSLY